MAQNQYLGVDRGLASRMAAAFWIVGTALALVVLPLAPPTAAIGDAGWVVAGVNVVFCFSAASLLLTQRRVSYTALLLSGYAGVAQIASAQWLAGGLEAPYWQLFILPALQISAVHPARRLIPFFAVLVAAAAAPLLYEGWRAETAAALALGALLWGGTSVITYRLMRELRQRRIDSMREENHAKRLARLDVLTGLDNRRAFDEAIERQIEIALATGEPLSLLVADVDRFKQINDEYGHVNGDSCLRQVAATIRSSVRATDACFRWGGDEFVVMLPNADAAIADELSARVDLAVRSSCQDPAAKPLTVSCAHTQLSEGMSTADLLESADLAMLTLKRARSAAA